MSLIDDVKRNLADWYAVTSDKTSEVARISSRRYDKFGISREIDRQFGEIGSVVYNGLAVGAEDLLSDPAIVRCVGRIKELEQELRVKDEEIAAIRRRNETASSPEADSTGFQPESGGQMISGKSIE